jgi:small nuclear ribonucleoprotein (snRNP)-like protein
VKVIDVQDKPTSTASLLAHSSFMPISPSPPLMSPSPTLEHSGELPNDRPALTALRALLRRTMRVTVYDGRVLLGTFVGTDKDLNVLLLSTQEFRPGPPSTPSMDEGRYVGQVMIPWRRVVKAEVQGRTEDDEYT